MSTLTIRNIDSEIQDGLCLATAAHGRSMEEARSVLSQSAAATCLAHGARLATRNVRDFDAWGLSWVNPWTP